jgi:glutaredoxin
MDQYIIVYTMKGCPFCDMMKKSLTENQIDFMERDIEKHEEEYNLFVKSTGNNEYVPAFMIIETDGTNTKSGLYAPERDYNTIDEGVKIIKEQILKK